MPFRLGHAFSYIAAEPAASPLALQMAVADMAMQQILPDTATTQHGIAANSVLRSGISCASGSHASSAEVMQGGQQSQPRQTCLAHDMMCDSLRAAQDSPPLTAVLVAAPGQTDASSEPQADHASPCDAVAQIGANPGGCAAFAAADPSTGMQATE